MCRFVRARTGSASAFLYSTGRQFALCFSARGTRQTWSAHGKRWRWNMARCRSAGLRTGRRGVAVGIRIAPYPPRGSVRAGFPHTALASGGDAQTARRIRMADMGRRQPAADEPLHSFPMKATFLAPSSEDVVPEIAHSETKVSQSVPVTRHSEVSDMPAHLGLQPLADFRNRVMHAPPQLDLHLLQFGLHSFANRLPKHQKPSLLRLPANMLE